jgi:hypothetical protein
MLGAKLKALATGGTLLMVYYAREDLKIPLQKLV